MNAATVLLLIHGLLSVALLGAVTHQAMNACWPARRPAGSFVGRFRAVPGAPYTRAIMVLYLLTFLFGGIVYAEYRIEIRIVIEQIGLWPQSGLFEIKEHFAAIGLGIMPAYAYYWRQPLTVHARTRAILTTLLAFIVWWNFMVGHILNNIRGFGS